MTVFGHSSWGSDHPPLSCTCNLQHSPVYTIGKRGGQSDFLSNPEALGAEVFVVPRGGETTFHGPGQLVVYPIVSLRELGVGPRAYVEGLEDSIVRAVGRYGISARVSCSYLRPGTARGHAFVLQLAVTLLMSLVGSFF